MATTLELPQTPEVAYFTKGAILGPGVVLEERDDGSALLKGLKIFRTGKLTDSAGRSRVWTHDELDAAVENFSLLRDELPDVPLRVGHTRHPENIGGYYQALRREGEFLIGDFEITEPDVVAKIKRRTFRSRSMEIGMFESESHGLRWPVALGLAFVDIPAVSGLYENPVTGKKFTVITPGEHPMGQENEPNLYAAYYAQGLADGEAQAQAHFAANPPAPPEFQCFGASVTDPAAVQAHIVALETFQRESVDNARKDFVASLVRDNKILAPQKEHFEAMALTLTPEQFESFKKGFADLPTNQLLSQYSTGNSEGSGEGGPTGDATQQRIATIRQIHQFHKMGGMSDDQIKTLDTYRELQELTGASK